jgi:hypothetical protein
VSRILLIGRRARGATSVPLAEQAVYVARSLRERMGAITLQVLTSQTGRTLLLMALLTLLSPGRGALAQRKLSLRPPSEALIDDVTGRTIRPPAEQLKLEVAWVAKVGGLEPVQAELLLDRASKVIQKRGGLFLQGGNFRVRAVRRWQVVDGRFELAASAPAEPPVRAIRRTLMPFLKDISADAAARVRAERDRLDAYRGQASLLAQVAVLDECLLLSDEQRTQLCASLAEATSDAWRATSPGALLDTPTHQLLTALADWGLGEFIVPEAVLGRLLRPWQAAAFKDLRQPVQEEVLLSQNVPPASVPAVLKEQAVMVAEGLHAKRHIFRRGENMDAAEQRFTRAMQQWVEDIETACELSAPQREKLILAGKLDLERFCQPSVLPKNPADGEVVVQTVRVCAGVDLLPLAVFRDDASHFQKALQSVLLEEQKRRLIESRRDFQRQALVEAVVVGFEGAASLTANQCEELSRLLNAMPAGGELQETAGWRLECLRRIADLPLAKIEHLLFDFQVDAVRRQQQRLAETAQQWRPSAPIAVVQVVRDKFGRTLQTRFLDDGTGANGGQG